MFLEIQSSVPSKAKLNQIVFDLSNGHVVEGGLVRECVNTRDRVGLYASAATRYIEAYVES